MSPGGLADALTALTRALNGLGSPSAIIGGVAVIAHGVPRATVNLRRVRAVVADFAAALEDSERPAALERLLREAGLV